MNKKIKNFSIIFLIVSLLACLITCLYITINKQVKQNDNIIINHKIKQTELSGIILDATMNTVTIKSNGNNYMFSIEDIDKTNIDPIILGNYATIKYDGKLNLKKDLQNVKVIKISVKEIKNDLTQQATVSAYKEILNDNGILHDYYKKAYNSMSKMTLDEKIGQLFLVRVPEGDAISEVSKYQFGGYILFGRDTKDKTKEELISNISSWNKASKIPLLIATDEEGGVVVRVSNNSNLAPSKFKSSQSLFASGGFEAVKNDTITKNNLLYSLGINVNLAPVADISTNPSDYIYDRTFGQNATQTAQYIKTVIEASHETSVSDVLKHFPGYGNNVDTHTGISIDNRTLDYFRENDFIPFKSGIKSGSEAILVSHNIITNVDSTKPASLSLTIHNILRNELGFTGIIITDDLAMDAIKNYVSKPSVQALKAGNDLIIITDYQTGIQEIKDALNNNEINEAIINQAVTRILAWKYYKKMIE